MNTVQSEPKARQQHLLVINDHAFTCEHIEGMFYVSLTQVLSAFGEEEPLPLKKNLIIED